jgi:hypothetical protein
LPENHLDRFIAKVIDQLDLSRLNRRYSGRSSTAHHPAVLEVQALLQKAAEAGQAGANGGLDLPGKLVRREDRLKALGEAKAKIAEHAEHVEQRDTQAQQAYQDKVNRC